MRRWPALLGAILAILVPGLVIAQSGKHLNPTVGDVWTYFGPTLGSGWGVAGSGGGGSPPGGSSGMIQYNNAGTLGGFLVTGDLSINTATGIATINPGVVSTGKIADGAVSGAKLAAGAASTNIGNLGGVLTGTLPNPGLLASGVTPASYTCASVTFDASGRATTASNGSCGGGSGSVTSVGLSVPGSSIFGVTGSPVTTSGTLGLSTTGTSGGVPYFNSTSTIASSALLAANGFVLGGGAGASPTATQLTGLVKGNGASAPAAAVVGSDYAAAPTGTANTPLFNNGAGGFTNGTRSGNTTSVATTSGALTSGNCGQFDANGNLVAGIGPCVTGSSLTSNRVIIGGGSSTVAALGSAGTTTTLLHGNAAGAPTFGAVSLTADVSGTLGGSSGGTGVNNGASTVTLGGSVTLPAAPASTQCLHMSSAGAITATGADCGSGVTQAATTATVTATQWANWQVFDVQAAAQTLTLPVVTSLSTSGGIVIKTEGNSVTLAPNAADGINGGTVGTSVTIPANFTTVVTTSGTSGTTALTAPLGLVAGSNITLTQNSNGTTTVAASGGGITCPTGFTAVRGDCVWTISAPTTTGCGAINCWAWTGLTTDKFALRCHGVLGGNSTASFAVQVGEGGTPTWQTGAAAYTYVQSATQANGSAVLTQSGTNLGFPGPYQPPTTTPTNVDLDYLIQDMASTTLDVSALYRTVNAPGGVFTLVSGYSYFNADNVAKTAIRVIDGQGTPVSAAGGSCTLVALGS